MNTESIINFINNQNKSRKIAITINILESLDIAGIELSEFMIAEFRQKLIAINAKFRFHSNEMAKDFVKWYLQKINQESYFNADETFKNYVYELGQPKLGNDGI